MSENIIFIILQYDMRVRGIVNSIGIKLIEHHVLLNDCWFPILKKMEANNHPTSMWVTCGQHDESSISSTALSTNL